MSSKFKTIDEAIEAVDGIVNLSVQEWDDGFTWEVTITTKKPTDKGTYEQFEYEWLDEDGAHKTATAAGIAACEVAIASMSAEQEAPDDN